MRRIIFAAAAMLSIACEGESYVETSVEPACGWSVVTLVSVDEEAGDCEWSIRSLDGDTARLRSEKGAGHDASRLCDITVHGSIDELRPSDVVEVWSAPGVDANTAWAAVEQSRCE